MDFKKVDQHFQTMFSNIRAHHEAIDNEMDSFFDGDFHRDNFFNKPSHLDVDSLIDRNFKFGRNLSGHGFGVKSDNVPDMEFCGKPDHVPNTQFWAEFHNLYGEEFSLYTTDNVSQRLYTAGENLNSFQFKAEKMTQKEFKTAKFSCSQKENKSENRPKQDLKSDKKCNQDYMADNNSQREKVDKRKIKIQKAFDLDGFEAELDDLLNSVLPGL